MKLARFNETRLGVVEDDQIRDMTFVLDLLPNHQWPSPLGDALIRHLNQLRPAIQESLHTAPLIPLADVTLYSPVANPSKIIAAPLNYKKHLEEVRADKEIHHGAQIKTIDDLGLFLKSSTSLVGPSEAVKLEWLDRRIDHELELAVIIGKEGKGIQQGDARDFIAGYSIGLDMSVRGTEDRSFRKSFDTFSVLGPWMVTADEITEPDNLDFWLKLNGETKQYGNTDQMIWGIPKLIEYASSAYTLHPGDILLSGTPEGVGPVSPGDVMDCWFDQIGAMQIAVE